MTSAVLAGLPHSGNNLLRRLLEAHGVAVQGIHHYAGGLDGRKPDFAVIPVRDPRTHWRSCGGGWDTHGPMPWDFRSPGSSVPLAAPFRSAAEMHYAHLWLTLRWAAVAGVPIVPASYADIVGAPDAAGERVLGMLGRPYSGWGEPIVDGDARWC